MTDILSKSESCTSCMKVLVKADTRNTGTLEQACGSCKQPGSSWQAGLVQFGGITSNVRSAFAMDADANVLRQSTDCAPVLGWAVESPRTRCSPSSLSLLFVLC